MIFTIQFRTYSIKTAESKYRKFAARNSVIPLRKQGIAWDWFAVEPCRFIDNRFETPRTEKELFSKQQICARTMGIFIAWNWTRSFSRVTLTKLLVQFYSGYFYSNGITEFYFNYVRIRIELCILSLGFCQRLWK